MAKCAILYRNLLAGLTPNAAGSVPAADLGFDLLIDPQPGSRARFLSIAATLFFDFGSARDADTAALVSTSLVAADSVMLRASSTQPLPASNLVLQSNTFSNAAWTKIAVTIDSPNALLDPDGGSTASELAETNANSAHVIRQDISGLPTNAVLNWSAYVKPSGRDWCRLAIEDRLGVISYYNFNVSTGAFGVWSFGALVTAKIEAAANGFYRCSLSVKIGAGGGTPNVRIYAMNADNSSETYTGTTGTGVIIAFAQLDYGAAAGTYAATTTAVFNPTYSSGVQTGVTSADYNGNVIATFPLQTLRYYRWDIVDATNPIDIGLAPMGLFFRPSRNFQYGAQEGVIDLSVRDLNPVTGAEFGISGPKKRTKLLTFVGLTKAEIRDTLGAIDREVGASGDVLFVEDPDASWLDRARDSIWGSYRAVGGGDLNTRTSAQRWARSFRLTERL